MGVRFDRLSRRSWCLVLGVAWSLHNCEEWLLAEQMLRFMQFNAPGFVRDAYAGLVVPELQAVLLILNTVLLVVLATAAVYSTAAASAFAVLVLAALLGLNAVFHLSMFVTTGIYAAGLVTAVLVSLPVAATVLVQGRRQRWVPASAYWAVVPAALVVHGPVLDVLFNVSRMMTRL